ncbi:penicillin-binding protein 2 [Nodularia chucula]|uniref:penicillin-binding protein 2 n=1 Tax=Nodularia chucula TaxID=3093667 RepID=UPI0039C67060
MTFWKPSPLGGNQNKRTVGRNFQPIFLILFTLSMTTVISLRLAYLQIIAGAEYRSQAESNRVRIIPKQPERGNIFDRNGKLLASNRSPRSVYLWPMTHTQPGWDSVGSRLEKILDIPKEEIATTLEEAGPNSSSLVLIARELTEAQVTAIKEYENELQNVEVRTSSVRYYPEGQVLAHILGYTRELTPEQLKERRDSGYRLGDVIGQMGSERAYENLLRGEWGGQEIEVNAAGRPIRILADQPAIPGDDITLTIDLNLQKAADKALGKYKGAIVALDPNNGEVLAMVSRPTFDPNIFSKQKLSQKDWESVQGANHPLVNRALSAFPPASTFKIVTTAAGLESGKFSPNTVLQTYGSLTISGQRFGEWNHAGFGPLGFVGAMQWSSDTFFYQIARSVGGPTLIEWTRKFGFGERTGFEFTTEESRGLVPDDEWKRRTQKMPWTIGDTINMSIGQGALLTTPLQVAVMFAVPGNGGYRVQPHLLKDNQEAKSWREPVNMKPATLKVLRDGLRRVITQGTAQSLNKPTLPPVAGKTGTAEAWQGKVKRNHAWFGGYAPADKPEILIVAFTEHSGGGGGSLAAPMVLEILEDYFQRKYPGKFQP